MVSLATTKFVIKNYETGLLTPNVDYLVHEMQLLLSHQNRATRIEAKGIRSVEHRFNIDRFRKEWKNILESVISKRENHEKENSIYQ